MSYPITRFMCSFCNRKHFSIKSSATRHERTCARNPAMATCLTCKHDRGLGCGCELMERTEHVVYECDSHEQGKPLDGYEERESDDE